MSAAAPSSDAAGPPKLTAQRRNTIIGAHQTCTAQSMQQLYESGDVIGTGSFGIIRKVKRKQDGKILARKELNYGRMDERDLRQLTEEVNILEQLGSNDNIVRYYERFVDKPNNMLYILMEYCEGGDLAGVIQRCRKTGTLLNEDVVWAYLTQITLALFDCHTEVDSNGARKPVILHRDIKPENVFLDKENNLKLGDFGLSKAMQQASMTNTYVGTPYYMSPELINGQPYDVKSDVWALGCLIYELCAGHPPFHEARTQPELAVLIREGKIPDLPKAYTPHLGQVIRAMLKQSAKLRPNTTQLKGLENVKRQIQAIEFRKTLKELRHRDQQVVLRETDLRARETSVLARERAVLMRENAIQAGADKLKGERALFAREKECREIEIERELNEGERRREDRENERPGSAVQYDEDMPYARVAGRPSLVPRPPLEDRRASRMLPRLASNLSLMSLDDTPTKPPPSSNNLISSSSTSIPPASRLRRQASKSMYNLNAAAASSSSVVQVPAVPRLTRMESTGSLYSRASMQESAPSPTVPTSRHHQQYLASTLATGGGSNRVDDSPISNRTSTLVVPQFGRRSETASSGRSSSPLRRSAMRASNSSRVSPIPTPSSTTLSTSIKERPIAPNRTSTAPAAFQQNSVAPPSTTSSAYIPSPATINRVNSTPNYGDEKPSPFLRTIDSSRFPAANSPAPLSFHTSSAYNSPTAPLSSRPSSSTQRPAARAAPAPPIRSSITSSASTASLSAVGSMANRLLASRAQSQVQAAREEGTTSTRSRRVSTSVGLGRVSSRVPLIGS